MILGSRVNFTTTPLPSIIVCSATADHLIAAVFDLALVLCLSYQDEQSALELTLGVGASCESDGVQRYRDYGGQVNPSELSSRAYAAAVAGLVVKVNSAELLKCSGLLFLDLFGGRKPESTEETFRS